MANDTQPKTRKNSQRQSKPQTDEFDQVIIDIARVTRVMAGGKRMRFRACVIVGNRRGKVGYAVAKGADVTLAVNKAGIKARKQLINFSIVNDTIPHRMDYKFGAAKVMLKPAPKGTGIIAGGAVRSVLELSGVSDVVAKILGSNNKINNVKATLEALRRLKHVEAKKVKNEEKAVIGKSKSEKSDTKKKEDKK